MEKVKAQKRNENWIFLNCFFASSLSVFIQDTLYSQKMGILKVEVLQ